MLLPEADKVVRDHLPTVLEAVGHQDGARSLRDLEPLSDRGSIVAACGRLRSLRVVPVEEAVWAVVVEDACFWCEAAVLAALRGDAAAFRHHVDKATAAMRSGLVLSSVH